MGNRQEIDADLLENISGGSLAFDPDSAGTYTMRCEFTGNVFYGVRLDQVIVIAQFGATVPNNIEGEQQIIAFAQSQGII